VSHFSVKKALAESQQVNSSLEENNVQLKNQCEKLTQQEHNITRHFETAKIRISQLEIDAENRRLKIRELNSKSSQVASSNEKLQLTTSDLQSKLDERERQLGELRELITQVDQERDGFQHDLDDKAELIVQLEGTCN
jgi:chromosome segregation ATPase